MTSLAEEMLAMFVDVCDSVKFWFLNSAEFTIFNEVAIKIRDVTIISRPMVLSLLMNVSNCQTFILPYTGDIAFDCIN